MTDHPFSFLDLTGTACWAIRLDLAINHTGHQTGDDNFHIHCLNR